MKSVGQAAGRSAAEGAGQHARPRHRARSAQPGTAPRCRPREPAATRCRRRPRGAAVPRPSAPRPGRRCRRRRSAATGRPRTHLGHQLGQWTFDDPASAGVSVPECPPAPRALHHQRVDSGLDRLPGLTGRGDRLQHDRAGPAKVRSTTSAGGMPKVNETSGTGRASSRSSLSPQKSSSSLRLDRQADLVLLGRRRRARRDSGRRRAGSTGTGLGANRFTPKTSPDSAHDAISSRPNACRALVTGGQKSDRAGGCGRQHQFRCGRDRRPSAPPTPAG